MRSQFRTGIDRQFETPAFGKFGLRGHLGNKTNKSGRGFFDTETSPGAGKKEEHDTRTIKHRTLMRSGPDMEIARERGPAALLIKSRDPFDVGGTSAEHIPQGNDVMLSVEQCIQ